MPDLSLFIPLTKIDLAQHLVYGIATAEQEDRAGEICDYATTKPLYEKWSNEISKASEGKSMGNLRAMHGSVAAGKVTAINFNDDAKQIEICAKVVDDAEWNKVVEGVYTGFSQGGAYSKRWKDEHGSQRYTADPYEISLVDFPCLSSATFQMIKANGAVVEHPFKLLPGPFEKASGMNRPAGPTSEETTKVTTKPADGDGNPEVFANTQARKITFVDDDEFIQVWQSQRDGTVFKFKADGRKHHLQLAAEAEAFKEARSAPQTRPPNAAKYGDRKHDFSDITGPKTSPLRQARYGTRLKAGSQMPVLIEKGLPTVARLACLIEQLKWIGDAVQTETVQEGDKSPLGGQLETSVANLCATLNAMCLEETTELINGQNADDPDNGQSVLNMAAALPKDHFAALAKFAARHQELSGFSDQLGKLGARNSQSDLAKIQAMHDTAVDLGAECGGDADKYLHGDLAKIAVELAKANERADKAQALADVGQKLTEALLPLVQGMEGRLNKLEAEPVPLPFAAGSRVVSKGQEAQQVGSQYAGQEEPLSIEEVMAKMTPEELRILVIKHAQKHPVSLTR
jgi:hypothetical protein